MKHHGLSLGCGNQKKTTDFCERAMPINTQITATVMIADVCRSSWLCDTMGDAKAAALISRTLQSCASIAERHGGRVLRSKGDDVLCIFDVPETALRTALEIHSASQSGWSASDVDCKMRIGIHTGPMLYSGGEVFGDTVNVAARLCDLAKGGQSIISQDMARQTTDTSWSRVRPLGDVSLKGKSGPMLLYDLLDPNLQDEITQVGTASLFFPASNTLNIRFQSREQKLDYLLVRYLLGRSAECDLVLEHPLVSRHHAEIRYQNSEFVLIDFSTNGTLLITGGEPRLLHHGQAALRGSGVFYLGRTNYNRAFEITYQASGGPRGFSRTSN